MASNERRTLNIRALMVDELSSQLSDIKKQISRTAEVTKKANDKAAKSWNRLKKAAAALAAVYAAIKAVQLTRSFVNEVDAIGKLAKATGESVEAVSELSFAFSAAGGSAQQFRAVLSSILSSQNQAIKATGDQRRAFELLGISVRELRTLSPGQILQRFSEGFDGVEDKTERLRQFARLFPEQWRNVINLVGEGADSFQRSIEDARRAGATVTGEQAKQAAKVNDAFLRVDTAVKSLGRSLLEVFGPALANGLNAFAAALASNKNEVLAFGRVVLDVVSDIAQVSLDAAILIASVPQGLEKAGQNIADALSFGYTEFLRNQNKVQTEQEKIQAQIDRTAKSLRTSVAIQLKYADATDLTAAQQKRVERRAARIVRREKELLELRRKLNDATPLNQKLVGLRQRIQGLTRKFLTTDQKSAIDEFFFDAGTSAGTSFVKAIGEGTVLLPQAIGDKAAAAGEASKTAFVESWEKGIASLKNQITNFGATVGAGLATLTQGGITAFSNELGNVINKTKDAEEAWKSFLNSSLQLLGKLIARLATLKLVETIGGAVTTQFADGGILPGIDRGSKQAMPVKAYAEGGIARRPQLALFGEGRQAEAFVPLPDNRSIPVSFTGNNSPSGTGAVVNLNVYAWDSKDAARGLVENQETIRSIIQTGAESRNGLRQTIQRAAR